MIIFLVPLEPSEWAPWGDCVQGCDGRTRSRTRTCEGTCEGVCDEPLEDTERCGKMLIELISGLRTESGEAV